LAIVALIAHFSGSIEEYQQGIGFAAWVLAVLPEICHHCGRKHVCILWSSYTRWVRTGAGRFQIRIKRVRCSVCLVTDALLPSFLHPFRHYALPLIQRAILLALEQGLWGRALVDAIGPYGRPAPATIREWVWSFALSAETWLVVRLQREILTLDPQASLDLGRPPAHLQAIANPKRRAAFIQGWQALRLGERLYADIRARKPHLIFQARSLFAFALASLQASMRIPRLLWPVAPARPP
jgi:hypothetical protein